jgi:lipopolysaccharide export system protein LptA
MKSRILTGASLFKESRNGLAALLAVFLLNAPSLLAQQGPTAPPRDGLSSASGEAPLDVENRQKISGGKPVNISSNQLKFDRVNGLTLFSGNVKVFHDGLVMNSDLLQASEGNRMASAFGSVRVDDLKSNLHLTCGNLDYNDLMNQITAHDHPVLSTVDEAGLPVTILSRQMELYAQEKKVVAHQDVEILRDASRSESQLATFDGKSDQLVLEENPRIFTPQGVIAGRRIVTSLSGDHRLVVEGMAEAEFYANPKPIPAKPPGPGTSTPLSFGPAAPTATAASPVTGTGVVRVDHSSTVVTPTATVAAP